jgi:hypothetical protein
MLQLMILLEKNYAIKNLIPSSTKSNILLSSTVFLPRKLQSIKQLSNIQDGPQTPTRNFSSLYLKALNFTVLLIMVTFLISI